jgi:hypothetical protein
LYCGGGVGSGASGEAPSVATLKDTDG